MEALPELSSLTDAELKDLIDRLMEEEQEVSYRRRMLHGKIDILRAERTARMKGKGMGEVDVDVDVLTDILSSRAAPAVGPDEGDQQA